MPGLTRRKATSCADQQRVLLAVERFISALEAADQDQLRHCLGPGGSAFGFAGAPLSKYGAAGPLPSFSAGAAFPPALRIVDPGVVLYEGTAIVTAYLANPIATGAGRESEAFRMSVFLARKGSGPWRIEHVNFSALAVPKLAYFATLPKKDTGRRGPKRPLILFLHGSAERGALDTVREWTRDHMCVPRAAELLPQFPFVVVTPSCPSFTSWSQLPFSVARLLDEVVAKYDVDPDRVYLTGLSMGGVGTWALASLFPGRFAALAPVCGFADPARMAALRNTPVWAFHGALDPVIPLHKGKKAIAAFKAAGGRAKFTVYPDVGHDCWERAYAEPELYAWFLEHRRRA